MSEALLPVLGGPGWEGLTSERTQAHSHVAVPRSKNDACPGGEFSSQLQAEVRTGGRLSQCGAGEGGASPGLLMDQVPSCRLRSVPPSAEWRGPGRKDARRGEAGWLAGSGPGIYGAALEQESLMEIYWPAYLLGVGPAHESEQVLSQPPLGRQWEMYSSLAWHVSLSYSTANNRLAGRERPRPTWSLCSNDAWWLRKTALPSCPSPCSWGGQLAAISGSPECLDITSCL